MNGKRFYWVHLWGCTEPAVSAPYETEDAWWSDLAAFLRAHDHSEESAVFGLVVDAATGSAQTVPLSGADVDGALGAGRPDTEHDAAEPLP